MNKKKLLTLVLTLVLIGVVGVGATLAYFTDNATALNTVTMGKVDIELEEPNFEADKALKLTPGAVVVKDPTITVASDSNPAYIRVKITDANDQPLSAELMGTLCTSVEDNPETDVNEALFTSSDDWTLGEGGYYYYSLEVLANEEVVVFNKVCIPTTWGNEKANAEFQINITAEAIQADNFVPKYNDEDKIVAWPNAGTIAPYEDNSPR